MGFIITFIAFILSLFAIVVLRGAPYVPTLSNDVQRALDLSGLKHGDTIVDLGSGDGKLLKAAAERGMYAIGYELNPVLALISRWRCRRYKKYVTVVIGDFWRKSLPAQTKGVFVFLAEPFMDKLERHLSAQATALQHPLIVISYAFELPRRKVERKDQALLRYEIIP